MSFNAISLKSKAALCGLLNLHKVLYISYAVGGGQPAKKCLQVKKKKNLYMLHLICNKPANSVTR